jgi:hypothetical protein
MAAELSNYVGLTLFQLSSRCPVPAGGSVAEGAAAGPRTQEEAGPGGVRPSVEAGRRVGGARG